MKLEINHKKKSGKVHKYVEINNILLKNQWVNEEIKGEVKKYLEINENKTYQIQ